MHILFITYYFGDTGLVAASRVTYWAKQIHSLHPEITCDVLTATSPGKHEDTRYIKNIYVVGDNYKSIWPFLSKDAGITWSKAILDFFNNEKDIESYDYILLTGSPFLHFGIASRIKKMLNAKIILDFRDPFAKNPRFNTNIFSQYVKQILERKYIKQADIVLTVNEYCKNLLTVSNSGLKKVFIIDNGYNDQIIDNLEISYDNEDKYIDLFYSGSILPDRNPENLLNVIKQGKMSDIFTFYHIGNPSSTIQEYNSYSNIYGSGMLSYKASIQEAQQRDIGLIFTSGKEFESTTKIFDYIGLNKPILIITAGDLRKGSLHEITKTYPYVYWAKNNSVEIEAVLHQIIIDKNKWNNISFADREKYSRKAGLEKLINILTQYAE